MEIKRIAVCIVAATLACSSADQADTLVGPLNLQPKLTLEGCTDPECSIIPWIGDLTANVWWAAKTMKGSATMSYVGNYGRVSITATTGGLSSEGHTELYVAPQLLGGNLEASTSKLTSKLCGQTAEGVGAFRAEIRMIISGLSVYVADATKDAIPALQAPCATTPGGGGNVGGNADPAVQWIPYTCYWTNTYLYGILIKHEDLGCVVG